MKIAIVIENFDLSKGGQERSTFEIAERLCSCGLEVSILTAEADHLPADTRSNVVDFAITTRRRVRHLNEFLRCTTQYLADNKFDVVHAITPIPEAHIYQPRGGLIQETFDRSVARHTGIVRLVRRIAGPNRRQRKIRAIERYLAENTPCRFLAVSGYVREQCMRHLHLSEDRVAVIFNGVDLHRLPEARDMQRRAKLRSVLKIGADQLAGCFVATNFKLKGLPTIIAAADRMKREHSQEFSRLRFLIAGPDKNRSWFHRLERMGLLESFIFLGPVSNISLLYEISDFLIHPTWYDPCSRVVLEAMACGLPSITTRYNGASELLKKNNCGLVIDDPGSELELGESWRKILDEDLRGIFSLNGKRLRNQISMDHHVSQLLEFYNNFVI